MNYKLINTIVVFLFFLGVLLVSFNIVSFLLVLGFAIGYVLFLLLVATNVQWNFFVNAFNNNRFISDKKIAITFDDGPVENTLRILEVLDKYQVKASFFCIGKNIEKNPDIFKKILEKGHFVGNHTYSHTRKMGFLSSSKILEEIRRCDDIAEKTGGVKLRTFRPPFGIINPKTKRALEISGHKVIGWNVRSYDAILSSKRYILKRILKKLQLGDVILLHDNNPASVEILEQLLLFLQDNDYSPVRVDNLFQIDAYY
ncbi:polysaccharide deacetylase family protein [Gillisia limnaea]|uniref:Polysaccharide deacetylase n=1 Tax=Gillisia limnaea (strain DSM 15749 / LMG 21470 / R-8282) TaxID=865937 RepID=H2BV22_GILLR|nr:polysaccharide deacetylase [Gillisia limnaea DSM 15749]